jgi:hypothetical protein
MCNKREAPDGREAAVETPPGVRPVQLRDDDREVCSFDPKHQNADLSGWDVWGPAPQRRVSENHETVWVEVNRLLCRLRLENPVGDCHD